MPLVHALVPQRFGYKWQLLCRQQPPVHTPGLPFSTRPPLRCGPHLNLQQYTAAHTYRGGCLESGEASTQARRDDSLTETTPGLDGRGRRLHFTLTPSILHHYGHLLGHDARDQKYLARALAQNIQRHRCPKDAQDTGIQNNYWEANARGRPCCGQGTASRSSSPLPRSGRGMNDTHVLDYNMFTKCTHNILCTQIWHVYHICLKICAHHILCLQIWHV
jgi:hypothetical protein